MPTIVDFSGDGESILLCKGLDPVLTYVVEINQTDCPDRVELHFVSDDRHLIRSLLKLAWKPKRYALFIVYNVRNYRHK